MTTKETVLQLLENTQEYISGSDIAKQLKISRASIWKAIKKLQNEGYQIDAITNKGYKLVKDIDVLSKEVIASLVHQPCTIEVENVVTSTNTLVVEKAVNGKPEGYVMIAGMQTKGKGRTGHTFFSPKQTGIYLSILLRPTSFSPMEATNITSMAAVAACKAMESMGAEPSIKWINDIFIAKRKVAGILTEGSINMETRLMDYVVMGIGINAYTPEGGFPEDIKEIAGSVFDERIENGRNQLAAAFLNAFFGYYYRWDKKEYYQLYKDHSIVLGKEILVDTPEGLKTVKAIDIDENFELVIEDDGIIKNVSSGEVHIKL